MNFIILSIITAFFFAVTFFLRKQAGKFIPVSTAYFIETCMQMILMTSVFFLVSPEAKHGLDFSNIKGYIFAGLAGLTVTIGVGISYIALKMGYLSTYQAIASPAQIIFAVLLGAVLLSESISIKQIIGTIISIIGILILVIK